MNSEIANVLEAVMVVCFGISWPINISKALRARTAKGVSLVFKIFIEIGYVAGIAGKIIGNKINYVFVFYIINFIMVAIDIALYFRNSALDRAAEADGR